MAINALSQNFINLDGKQVGAAERSFTGARKQIFCDAVAEGIDF